MAVPTTSQLPADGGRFDYVNQMLIPLGYELKREMQFDLFEYRYALCRQRAVGDWNRMRVLGLFDSEAAAYAAAKLIISNGRDEL